MQASLPAPRTLTPPEPVTIPSRLLRRPLAAWLALAVLALAAPRARAQADDPLDPLSAPSQWQSPGRAGWTPDAALGLPGAWTLAGLARGGWAFDSPLDRAPTSGPGVREAVVPRAWWDSLAVTVGEGAAWQGWDGSLARTEAFLFRPAPGRAHTVATVVNGSSSLDRNAALFSRGDARGWIRAGATGDSREGVGALGPSGAHAWTAGAAWIRGAHRVDAHFRQRGYAARQEVGVGEDAKGESGRVTWHWEQGGRWSEAALQRAWDFRTGLTDVEGVQFDPERRDAQRTGVDLSGGLAAAGGRLSARFTADQEEVRRHAILTRQVLARAEAQRWWSALRYVRPLAGGSLDATLGGGWHSLGSADRRARLAPALAWRRAFGANELRLFGERVLTPVWSDLGEGTKPFVQDTWAAGAEGLWRAPGVASLRVRALSGRTEHAANDLRYPIADVALRDGARPDTVARAFALVTAAGAAHWGALAAELEVYAAPSDRPQIQPRFDPETGAAGRLELEFPAFQGDLRVRLVGEAAYVGRREALLVANEFGDLEVRSLGGYTSFNGLASLSLGEAVVRLRAVNLADVRRPDVWQDPGTGQPALGSGRQLLFELSWTFEN